MRHSDVLVVGAGMAGLMAAVTAAKSGASVSVLSEGAGVISIGSGAVDFLGYVNGKKITDNPFNHLSELGKEHPYNIIGAENIKNAFASLIEISKANGYEIKMNEEGLNQTAVSIAGTTKPTYICSESNNASRILKAKKILFAGVEYLKDAQPALAVKQAKQYKVFADAEINSALLKSPFGKTHRTLNSLDLARYVDKEEGFNWLKSELKKAAAGYDAVIIPPICGTVNYTKHFKELQNFGFILVEAVSVPPGVGGYRLRNVLINEAKKLNVKFIENSTETGESIAILKIVSYTLSGVEAIPPPITPPVAIINLSAVYSVSKAPAILLCNAITLLHLPFSTSFYKIWSESKQ